MLQQPVLLLHLLDHGGHVLLHELDLLLLPGQVALKLNDLLDQDVAVRYLRVELLEGGVLALRRQLRTPRD